MLHGPHFWQSSSIRLKVLSERQEPLKRRARRKNARVVLPFLSDWETAGITASRAGCRFLAIMRPPLSSNYAAWMRPSEHNGSQ